MPNNPNPHGDEQALYQSFGGRLIRALKAHGFSDELAREAAQSAWLIFLEVQPSREFFEGWMITVAKREGYRIIERSAREQPVEQIRELASDDDMAESLARSEVGELLTSAVAEQLTENQRVAVTLWAEGYSYKEIAAETGKSYTWVNRHLTEGRARLRKIVGLEP